MSCALWTTNYITACAVRLSLKMKHSFSLVSKFSWITFKSICMYMSSALHWALSLHMLYPMTACWMSARVKKNARYPHSFCPWAYCFAHRIFTWWVNTIFYSILFHFILFYAAKYDWQFQSLVSGLGLEFDSKVLIYSPKINLWLSFLTGEIGDNYALFM